jgi:hypothetical protein
MDDLLDIDFAPNEFGTELRGIEDERVLHFRVRAIPRYILDEAISV